MDTSEETKFCSNCKRDIAAANYVMHEVHCKRNIILCKKCKEPVPRSELDSHMEEVHAKVNCDMCRAEMERCDIDDHKGHCPKRPQGCSYCELEFPADELKTHLGYCGSRTEPCVKCGQYIMLKDQIKHDESNCSYPQQKPSRVQNNQLNGQLADIHDLSEMNSFALGEIGRMMNAPGQVSQPTRQPRGLRSRRQPDPFPGLRVQNGPTRAPKRTNELRARGSEPAARRNNLARAHEDTDAIDIDQLLAMHLAHDLNNSEENIDDLLEFMPEGRPQQMSPTRRSPTRGVTQPEYSRDGTCLPCEFCDEFIPANSLIEHERECRFATRNNRVPTSPLGSPNHVFVPSSYTSGTCLPCEFCEELIPADLIIEHQSGCRPDLTRLHRQNAIRNNHPPSNRNVSDSRPTRKTQDNRDIPPLSPVRNDPAVVDNLSYLAAQDWLAEPLPPEFTSEDDIMLPCEFCDKAIPEEYLVQHQAVCKFNPTMTPRVMSPAVQHLPSKRSNSGFNATDGRANENNSSKPRFSYLRDNDTDNQASNFRHQIDSMISNIDVSRQPVKKTASKSRSSTNPNGQSRPRSKNFDRSVSPAANSPSYDKWARQQESIDEEESVQPIRVVRKNSAQRVREVLEDLQNNPIPQNPMSDHADSKMFMRPAVKSTKAKTGDRQRKMKDSEKVDHLSDDTPPRSGKHQGAPRLLHKNEDIEKYSVEDVSTRSKRTTRVQDDSRPLNGVNEPVGLWARDRTGKVKPGVKASSKNRSVPKTTISDILPAGAGSPLRLGNFPDAKQSRARENGPGAVQKKSAKARSVRRKEPDED